MKFIECAQGTPEWLQARAGAITASRFADAISTMTRASGERKPGDPTAAADKYAGDVAIERISGKPYGEPPKAWTLERGHILEAEARTVYEARFGLFAMESGIVKTDDDWFGYSTDGLVGTDGLIEVKCPVDSQKIMAMFQAGDVSEYIHQIQGGLWITGRQWCDFLMYVPDLAVVGNELYVRRIYRDEKFIETLEVGLLKFRTRVQVVEAMLRRPLAANADLVRAAA
jgi:exodeoxyribonuclease (lambda-induced)